MAYVLNLKKHIILGSIHRLSIDYKTVLLERYNRKTIAFMQGYIKTSLGKTQVRCYKAFSLTKFVEARCWRS